MRLILPADGAEKQGRRAQQHGPTQPDQQQRHDRCEEESEALQALRDKMQRNGAGDPGHDLQIVAEGDAPRRIIPDTGVVEQQQHRQQGDQADDGGRARTAELPAAADPSGTEPQLLHQNGVVVPRGEPLYPAAERARRGRAPRRHPGGRSRRRHAPAFPLRDGVPVTQQRRGTGVHRRGDPPRRQRAERGEPTIFRPGISIVSSGPSWLPGLGPIPRSPPPE